MKRKIDASIDRKALAGLVCETLRRDGIDAVLVGGAVVSLYSGGRWLSDDLDFVSYQELPRIAQTMRTLGFEMVGRRAIHPRTPLYVEFCNPPLAVGNRPVRPRRLRTTHGALDTLTPTDCVMDRLAAFYYWNDRQALEQALDVARRRKVKLDELERWSRDENQSARFGEFRARLQGQI